MKIETNHILYVARLPIHFWNELKQVEDFRENVGAWLQSYVIAKTLNLEYTELPSELHQAFLEAESFSEDVNKLADWLGAQLKGLLEVVPESHHLHGLLSTLAYNFFAGMGVNTVHANRREILITSKLEFDRLRQQLLKSTLPPKETA